MITRQQRTKITVLDCIRIFETFQTFLLLFFKEERRYGPFCKTVDGEVDFSFLDQVTLIHSTDLTFLVTGHVCRSLVKGKFSKNDDLFVSVEGTSNKIGSNGNVFLRSTMRL